MKVIICALMFDEVEKNIEKAGQYVPVSGHLYQQALIDGLLKNDVDIMILNTQRVNKYPIYPQVYFPKTDFLVDGINRGINFRFINFPVINFFSKIVSLRKELIKSIGSEEEQTIVVVYNSPITILISMLLAKRKRKGINLCASVGDIPGKFSFSVDFHGIKKIKLDCINYAERKLLSRFDSFVFVTEHMAEALKVQEKPHIVIECLMDTPEVRKTRKKVPQSVSNFITDDSRVVFYAGGINIDYGIEHLLKSFVLIDNRQYRLIIAGDGPATDLVREYEQMDDRIKALGLITPDEVSEIERISTVIVNPRLSNKEYVKYSFPSKTYTALASGKPLIGHRLPCYPEEYDKYIQYPEDESDQALKEKIIEICELPKEKRDRIGTIGKNYINNEKNHVVLTRKIIKMWREIIKERE